MKVHNNKHKIAIKKDKGMFSHANHYFTDKKDLKTYLKGEIGDEGIDKQLSELKKRNDHLKSKVFYLKVEEVVQNPLDHLSQEKMESTDSNPISLKRPSNSGSITNNTNNTNENANVDNLLNQNSGDEEPNPKKKKNKSSSPEKGYLPPSPNSADTELHECNLESNDNGQDHESEIENFFDKVEWIPLYFSDRGSFFGDIEDFIFNENGKRKRSEEISSKEFSL